MRYKAVRPIVLFCLVLIATSNASSSPASLTEQQKLTHVLNRLGFGPRPGDMERGPEMGLREYIEQQLKPESINDARTDDRVRHLSSLEMSLPDVFEQYPDPQRVAQSMGIRNPKQGDNAAANREKVQQYMITNMLQRPAAVASGTADQDHSGRLQRAPASGSDDRFLVQPLQYLLG